MKKKKILLVFFLIVAFLVAPIAGVIAGFATPSQYSDTYYAVLSDMYNRLCGVKGKKIVIIGTSSVAFGIDSALMEEQLSAAGEEYTVVNFGLYGALGTKLMLDLSEKEIRSDDIVIFAPEPHPQSMSLYFSAQEMWYAADSDFSLLAGIDRNNLAETVGAFPSYVAKKYGCLKSRPAQSSGIYARTSFDGRCDLKNYERPYNILIGGYDANNTVAFNPYDIGDGFIAYVNGYCERIGSRGAKMFYSFAPVNADGLLSDEEEIESYYEFISENFLCPVISDPHRYIMESDWFYDSNFHLNSAGMTVRTVNLVNDIKNYLGITAPTLARIPEKPKAPQNLPVGDGDNAFADCFEYLPKDEGYVICALSPSAADYEKITVPFSYNGKPIVAFNADVFAGNEHIREIEVQENISVLYNGSFDGCVNLEKLILKQKDPSRIGVGQKLLKGASSCKIYVRGDALGAYVSNYFWSYYAENLAVQ